MQTSPFIEGLKFFNLREQSHLIELYNTKIRIKAAPNPGDWASANLSDSHRAFSLSAIWGDLKLLGYGLDYIKIEIARSRVIFFCIYFKRLDRIKFLNFYLKINEKESVRDKLDDEGNRPYFNISMDIEKYGYDQGPQTEKLQELVDNLQI